MEEKTRRCKYCNSEIKIKPGINNWKNLFRKPTFEDWITLFIIIMLLVSAYAYKSDLKAIVDYYEDENYCNNQLNQRQDYIKNSFQFNNISNISIKGNGQY